MSLIRSMSNYLKLKYSANYNGIPSNSSLLSHPRGLAEVLEQKRLFSGNQFLESKPMIEETSTSSDAGNQSPSNPKHQWSFSIWAKWVVGSVLALAVPFWRNEWKTLVRLEGEVEMVVDVVENVAEVVEKVATVAENISSNVANSMPEKGKLKDAARFIEHVSEEVAQDAHLVQDIIHKVDELKQDVETIIESAVDGTTNENQVTKKFHGKPQ